MFMISNWPRPLCLSDFEITLYSRDYFLNCTLLVPITITCH